MKLLITGGTGFIGSRLALEARSRGIEVTVAGQVKTAAEHARHAELLERGVQIDQGPLQDASYARSLVRGCTAVIHLAAAQHEANVPDAYFETVNVTGTRMLLEASRDAGVQRFVYGSTIGVYGDAAGGILDELSPPRPVNVYGRTKLAAEEQVRTFGQSLPTTIIRISETYGPSDFRLLKLFRAIDRRRFFMIGAGTNRHQLIHVRDLVQALLLAMEHPAAVGQTVVVAGSEAMTTHDMVSQITQALGRSLPAVRAPLWPFVFLAGGLELLCRPLGIQPPLHRRRLDFFRKSFVFDTTKAQAVLGFTPVVAFSDGAAEAASWYRKHGYLPG
ncbi:MAG TPA: NAD-dependent epimerase/dehydratase family protein [Steroidobacteraceae bacterium]|nr:NAD-dependent epimerase/dehydratase family protein [Steroidobacteraceae bacterium]